MALPKDGTRWPPANQRAAELATYANLYAARTTNTTPNTPPGADPDLAHPHASNPQDSRRARGNITADIASIAAASIIGTGITLTPPENTPNADNTRQRLAGHAERLNAVLLEGSELGAVFGDTYYKTVTDPALAPHPTVAAADATRTLPVFAGQHLVAATFWTDLHTDGNTVIRYVEQRNNRTRTIHNGLYLGTLDNVGKQIPLTEHDATADLPEQTSYPDGINRMVWHVPNMRPNRRNPQLPYGRSDFQGSESLAAAYDITLTALIRSVRLSQPQIVVPEGALTPIAGQHGYMWDEKREMYTTLEIAPESGFSLFQADIRSAEQLEVLRFLAGRITESAGLSLQTVGLGDYGNVTSGSALRTLLERTISTVEAKRRHLAPAVVDIAATLLLLDRVIFGQPVDPVEPTVTWPAVVSESGIEQATRLETLRRAQAVSTQTAVKQVNPGMTDRDVADEVARVMAENGLAPDPELGADPETPVAGL